MKRVTKKQVANEIKQARATITKLTAALSEADKAKVDLTCVLELVSMADGELLVALRDLQAAKRRKSKGGKK